ncbi:MAG TPA: MbtH family NRPS accessory protein [Actinocrinis sp.]|uniref:MbtH family NRPS accessory protein n=1 Tax=Actinocrinis sp. TaxID=1920516 RepID=UPI002DDCBC65|nr:MbtH family NRPS accessory protein [Actinocrinis sp.]HEV2344954.1 MbtH family NRPS accessory protein [Actinocrinis sp.]
MSETGSGQLRRVMLNDGEQHSPWSADREPPAAWRHAGFTGTEAECGEHIDEVLDRPAPRVAVPVDGAARRLRGRLTDTSRRPAETATTNLKARS